MATFLLSLVIRRKSPSGDGSYNHDLRALPGRSQLPLATLVYSDVRLRRGSPSGDGSYQGGSIPVYGQSSARLTYPFRTGFCRTYWR